MKGKAKIDFEQWYKQKYFLSVEGNCDSCGCGIGLPFEYDRLPQSMQQGVLLEFFRERGIEIWWDADGDGNYEFYIWKKYVDPATWLDPFENYNTAFTHAIDKACEIINRKEN